MSASTSLSTAAVPRTQPESDVVRSLYGDGMVALRRAFPPGWADAMREDIERAFRDAMGRPGGAVGRQVTPDYHASLPDDLRRHLHCRVVERLEPVVQKHQIDGLVMGRPDPGMGRALPAPG